MFKCVCCVKSEKRRERREKEKYVTSLVISGKETYGVLLWFTSSETTAIDESSHTLSLAHSLFPSSTHKREQHTVRVLEKVNSKEKIKYPPREIQKALPVLMTSC